ncbi:Dipeptidyl aminopeptidase BIII [Candidatus Thermoflexus japonica]|uniref:Dipeptidyl aminopeptidase BIII n=1 Tax=Candidatus Thermoflexus japonica TaxID=2035417 RepID=A0A2H5Y552_9CHLR|nr:Dipeptidyl aminopeptidase BIII [Candidatus Thermoflexus japonica]
MISRSIPYGLWPSPLAPERMAATLRITDVQWDPSGRARIWREERSGHGVLTLQKDEDAPRDLTEIEPVRARIGYGGGDFSTGRDIVIYAGEDGRLYRLPLHTGLPQPITPPFGNAASPTLSPDGRWVLFVHSDGTTDALALVDAEGRGWPQKVSEGADFYMQPVWHPTRPLIAWVEWDHPNMPWDGARLALARLEGDPPRPTGIEIVAGDAHTPVFQPAFSPDGRFLSYILTPGEWDALVVMDLETGARRVLVEGTTLMPPAWVQGLRVYGWSPRGDRIFFRRNENATASLESVDLEGRIVRLDLGPYTWFDQLAVAPDREALLMIASSPLHPPRVISWEDGRIRVHRYTSAERVPLEALSSPQPIQWPAPDGTMVHGLYYPPAGSGIEGKGLPPAIISIHGGPTSQRVMSYNADAQFFATRGFAYLEVNYRGSTGYGRSYRDALKGNWGVLDVEDAVGGARALVERGLADPRRLVIMGGSAGGYTVLNALIRYPGFFRAGICLFGVTNLFTLAAETHKFEAHYLDTLVGPLPEAAERYRERSPIFHADRIQDPVAIFQGAEDQVVPPNQAEAIVDALRRRGVPHLYRLYPGEGHGWRRAETIIAFYREVLDFLRQYVLFA